MELVYLEEFPRNKTSFMVLFEGRGINDRGVKMAEVIETRIPTGIFSFKTKKLTRFDGTQELNSKILSEDTCTRHEVRCRNIADALQFVQERYPDLLYRRPEEY